MNAAIKWMMSKSTVETLEDGTVSYFFSGNIPNRMKQEIIAASTSNRGSNRETSYSHNDESFGWSATFGAFRSNNLHVRFSYNDYTVPMGR